MVELIELIYKKLSLIEKTNLALSELRNIAIEEKYDQDNVINELDTINALLNELFKLPDGYEEKYTSEITEWKKEFYKNLNTLNDLLNGLDKITRDEINDKNIEEKAKQLESYSLKYNEEEMTKIFDKAFNIDLDKLFYLMSKMTFSKISFRRKIINYIINYNFKFRFLLSKLSSLVIAYIISEIINKNMGNIFPLSEIAINILALFIGYFTIDKLIAKLLNILFWRKIRKQTFRLSLLLLGYTNQLVVLTEFIKFKKG